MTSPAPTTPPACRGTLVFDGSCGFCRLWIERWKEQVGPTVEFVPYQEAQIPGLDPEACARAVQWVGADNSRASGAEAVFLMLAGSSFAGRQALSLFRKVPLFARAASGTYRLVADHRPLFSAITKLLWGREVRRPTFANATEWFLQGLALVYLIAFVSYLVQFPGLLGERGITPAREFFENARGALGGADWGKVPSLLWFGATNSWLTLWCWLGIGCSVVAITRWARGPALLGAFGIYLSLCWGGGVFYQFQWDILLLETGFLALFCASWSFRPRPPGNPPRLARFLLVWLLFRLMVASAVVKLTSGDATWWPDLTALNFHYFTQPLPTPLAWHAHQLPDAFQKFSVLAMFFIELAAPILMFGPRRLRLLAFALLIFLQVLIALTGNYGFFNLLTILLCLLLLDDATLRRKRPEPAMGLFPKWLRIPAAGFLLLVSLVPFASAFRTPVPLLEPLAVLHAPLAPFRIVNGYGLFAVMTTSRPEILIQGSHDGLTWKTYTFRFKPGDLHRTPPIVAPYMPRLDWQMWFAALGPVQRSPWFYAFAEKLLNGEPEVLALLEGDPFQGSRPRFLRAHLDSYTFTNPEQRKETKAWWNSEPQSIYLPEVSLQQ